MFLFGAFTDIMRYIFDQFGTLEFCVTLENTINHVYLTHLLNNLYLDINIRTYELSYSVIKLTDISSPILSKLYT